MFRRLGSNVPYLMLLLIFAAGDWVLFGPSGPLLDARAARESIPIPSDMVAFDFPIDQVHTGCPGVPKYSEDSFDPQKESDKNSSTVFYSADGMWTVYIPREDSRE